MSKTRFTYQQEQEIYKALKALSDNEFDYPDYGGLPEEIFCVFSCDQVDYIQQMIQSEWDRSGDNVVAFGQQLDKTTWYGAEKAAMSCSLMIVLGSSLSVYPAAGLVEVAQKMGADTVIINNQYTDYDRQATLVIRGSIAGCLPQAISKLNNSTPN